MVNARWGIPAFMIKISEYDYTQNPNRERGRNAPLQFKDFLYDCLHRLDVKMVFPSLGGEKANPTCYNLSPNHYYKVKGRTHLYLLVSCRVRIPEIIHKGTPLEPCIPVLRGWQRRCLAEVFDFNTRIKNRRGEPRRFS